MEIISLRAQVFNLISEFKWEVYGKVICVFMHVFHKRRAKKRNNVDDDDASSNQHSFIIIISSRSMYMCIKHNNP